MRSAVVAALRGMLEVGRVLGHKAPEKFLEITPCGRVGVFHQDQAATGMPNEYSDDASGHAASADGGSYPISDLVGAFAVGRDNNARGATVAAVAATYNHRSA